MKCSTSLVIKEMQIKTILRFHLTPIRKVISKGSNNNKCWWGCNKAGTLIHCWWECKFEKSLCKAVWTFLIELKKELPYDPVILSIFPKVHKSGYNRGTCTPMCIAALFTIAKLEATQLPYNWWVDQENVVNIPHGLFLSHKEQWQVVWR
jgi:hypothetical protein